MYTHSPQNKTSVNNSSGYHYLKITRKSAFIQGQIFGRIVVCNLTWMCVCVKIWVFGLTWYGLEIVIRWTRFSIRRKTARTLLIKDYANSLTNTIKQVSNLTIFITKYEKVLTILDEKKRKRKKGCVEEGARFNARREVLDETIAEMETDFEAKTWKGERKRTCSKATSNRRKVRWREYCQTAMFHQKINTEVRTANNTNYRIQWIWIISTYYIQKNVICNAQ